MNIINYTVISFLFFDLIYCYHDYKKYTIEDDDICSEVTTRKKKLDDGGLIVYQTRLNEHPIDWGYDKKCKFQIKVTSLVANILAFHKPSGSSRGIIANIQKLSLRQDKTTGECIDYVYFQFNKYNMSKKFCGNLSLDNEGNVFHMIDPYGKIDTYIFIDRKKLEPHEYLDLVIVYTPFITCAEPRESYINCIDNDPTGICIQEKFINDSYFNCPNCFDEGGCRLLKIKHSSDIATVAALTALSSLIIIFIAFLACIWICKKVHLLCWSESFFRGRVQTQDNFNLQRNNSRDNNIPEPTAPPVPDVNDKDLPPPYESLFPDR